MSHHFYPIDNTAKADIFTEVGNVTGLPPHAVEKDWWVVQTLSMIFSLDIAPHIVFKGGTSLSKGWNLIERFSEDIDLAIDRKRFGFEGDLDRKGIDKLRKTTGAYIDQAFVEAMREMLASRGYDKVSIEVEPGERSDRDRSILLHYPYVAKYPGYILPKIKIEFSCRSLMEPSSPRTFSSLVDTVFADKAFAEPAVTVATVNPERTFLEKIFLLHEEFQRPIEKVRSGERLSRHLYDVVKLGSTAFADTALGSPGLFCTIVAHRSKFNAIPGIDYSQHVPAQIQIIPPDAVLDAWKADYNIMLEEMIHEENAPKFDVLMERLVAVKQRINRLDWAIN